MNLIKKGGFTVLLFFLMQLTLYGQTGDLRGFVFNLEDGTPLEGANIVLLNNGRQMTTDLNGYYTFGKMSAGKFEVKVVLLGFDSIIKTIIVFADRAPNTNFYLKSRGNELGTTIFQGGRTRKDPNSPEVGRTEIRPRDFSRLPSFGGDADLVQFLQILPGVVTSGDQGGQLYIRGGSPVMNKVLLDGMTIYNPFHSIGLYSVFDQDMIKSADIYTAGFNVQYGGRISAVMDVQSRDGNPRHYSGKVNVSPFASKIIFEGPLKAYKPGMGSSSFLVSYRNSYLNKTAPILFPYAGKNQGGLPFSFGDLYTKATFNGSSGSKTNLFYFNFKDKVNFANSTSYAWDSWGMGANFTFYPEGSGSIINGSISFSDYKMNQIEKDQKPRYSGVNGFNASLNITNIYQPAELKYGLEINGFSTDFQTFNQANRKIEQQDYNTELTAYIKYKNRFKRWVVEPGLRFQFYASLNNISLEPRCQAKYDISSKMRIKISGGFYSQNLMSAVSDRDVVNLFYGFLSSPDQLPSRFNGHQIDQRIQKSRQFVTGYELDINPRSSIMVEGYLKDFTQLTNVNRDKIFDNTLENQFRPEVQRLDYIVETGLAKGLDFKYQYEYKRWYLWLVYSLTYVDRYDGIRRYFPHFDRRHNLNALASYTIQKKKTRYHFNLRWNLGSGFPFTKTQGFYELLSFDQGIGSDYTQSNGQLGIHYADINTGRLPYFHRMDLSIDRRQELKGKKIFTMNVSVINVYNRANIFYFDRVKNIRVNQLPILPSLSMSFSF